MSDLSDTAIAAYCAELSDLEDSIEQAQQDKKDFFASAREAHGRTFVAALKLAIKTDRMDSDKRSQAEEIDAEAERILRIMRKGPRVARGARTRESEAEAAGADPETGEFQDSDVTTESVAPVIASEDFVQVQPGAQSAVAVAGEASASVSPASSIPVAVEGSGSTGGTEVGGDGENSAVGIMLAPPSFANVMGGESAATKPVIASSQKPIRPYCLKPHSCGGMGRQHCWSCQRAHDQERAGALQGATA